MPARYRRRHSCQGNRAAPPNLRQTMATIDSTPRAVLRAVLIVVSVVLTIYVIYLLRTPISWIVIAGFVAIAVSGPVAVLEKRMPRGAAIALVYTVLVAIPLTVAALLIPALVNQG